MKVNKWFYSITLLVLLGHGLGIMLGHPAITQGESSAMKTFYLPFTEPSVNFVLNENQQFNPLTPKIKVQLPGIKSPGNIQINSYHKYNPFLHFNVPTIAYKFSIQACSGDG